VVSDIEKGERPDEERYQDIPKNNLTKKRVFNNILNLRDSFTFLISYKGDLARYEVCGKKH